MSNYDAGRRFEWKVRDALRADGYDVLRSRGSKSAVDLVAIKYNQILFIQAKRQNGTVPPAERQALLRLAQCGAIPLVAHQPAPRKPITYRRLTGPGPKDWAPWTADWAVTP